MTEDQIHKSVVSYLKHVLPKASIFHHSPNESNGNVAHYSKRKAMGVRSGWPDLEVFIGGSAMFIELKTPKGRLSDNQKEVGETLRSLGFGVYVCRSIDDVKNALDSEGLL